MRNTRDGQLSNGLIIGDDDINDDDLILLLVVVMISLMNDIVGDDITNVILASDGITDSYMSNCCKLI